MLDLNVDQSQELCFEFGNIDTTTLTLETPAAKSGATAYAAGSGALPTNVAIVTGNQLKNSATLS